MLKTNHGFVLLLCSVLQFVIPLDSTNYNVMVDMMEGSDPNDSKVCFVFMNPFRPEDSKNAFYNLTFRFIFKNKIIMLLHV